MSPQSLFQEACLAHQRGETQVAESAYRKILQTEPRNGRVWLNLGSLCADQGRLVEAAGYLRQAIEILPREPQAYLALANTLLKQENYPSAESEFRHCLELLPDSVEALVNLGFVLGEQERYEEAIATYELAKTKAPRVPEIHHNLGNMLRDVKRFDEALASYDEALRLRPNYPKALVNKGIALATNCMVYEAAEWLRKGIELQPDFAEAHNTLGHALSASGQFDEALVEFERAIQLKKDYADPNWNRSLLWLLLGDFERGWPAVEWRWKCRSIRQLPAINRPRWDGTPLPGKTVLLHAEQGLGDTLHFIRYAPLVKARVGKVIIQCQGTLIPLLARCDGIDQLVAWGAPVPACDAWLPMMSLPGVFKTELSSIPAKIPYVFAEPARIESWRQELAGIPGFRIGIAWQGSPRHPWDQHRSVPISLFEPLSRIPGVQLISLQKGHGSEQLQERPNRFSLVRLGEKLDYAGAFTDTAAILQNLDLVVTIDSSIAHLGGALGVPTWIVLHRTPDWRWMLDRSDSPWYPSVRLFRQAKVNDWESVFRQVAAELAPLVAEQCRLRPLRVEVSAGELIDKLTILHIKTERIVDSEKLRNVKGELNSLLTVRATLESSTDLEKLEDQLRKTNERLWDIEDAIRDCEERQDFGSTFIELARSVYRTNDLRAHLKRQINDLLGSRIIEEKSYAPYAIHPAPLSDAN